MIGVFRRWSSASWADPERIAASLGLFAGCPADVHDCGNLSFYRLASPRARPTRGWRVTRTSAGNPVLLCGWLDDRPQLAAALGIASDDATTLYGAAFEQWGDRADARVSGTYSAIIALPDGRLRLARSAPGGLPLFYAATPEAAVVCSIPRPIFASGHPERLRDSSLHTYLALEIDEDPARTLYHGLDQVPGSSICYLSPEGASIDRWYDAAALPPTRYRRDEDYVEAARALLADSVRNALDASTRPALSLSGGLDSAIAGAEVLRQLGPDRELHTFTFHPLAEWTGEVPPTSFGDERAKVEEFAAMHPGVVPHFVDGRGLDFDDRAQQLFLACSTAYPANVSGTLHHAVNDAAVAHGADWLFTAVDGNISYSFTPPWIWASLLRRGRWGGAVAARRRAPRRSPQHSAQDRGTGANALAAGGRGRPDPPSPPPRGRSGGAHFPVAFSGGPSGRGRADGRLADGAQPTAVACAQPAPVRHGRRASPWLRTGLRPAVPRPCPLPAFNRVLLHHPG
jgi:asparagine synthase (glutamine-hydrolysing)